MTAKRRGLGRGLGALIPTGPEPDEQASGAGATEVDVSDSYSSQHSQREERARLVRGSASCSSPG